MQKPILARWIGVLVITMLSAAARAQPSITFVNYGIGWAAPWYGLAEADPSSTCVVQGANSGAFVTADNAGLAGTGLVPLIVRRFTVNSR
jgi:hypothetical protein